MRYSLLFVLLGSLIFNATGLAQSSQIPNDYHLIYFQDFDSPQSIRDFEMTDPAAWKLSMMKGEKTLELHGKSNYEGPVRSPFNIALLKDVIVGEFIMEVDLAQSGKEYGHRDLCLFFGAQSDANFYYVHIATKADDHANNIFIVNNAPRVKIAEKTTTGSDWGKTNSWHKARIERDVKAGTIRVYFDDMSEPIMTATDTHFLHGRIGFGSFDDTGRFDNIRIWAPELLQPQSSFFKKP